MKKTITLISTGVLKITAIVDRGPIFVVLSIIAIIWPFILAVSNIDNTCYYAVTRYDLAGIYEQIIFDPLILAVLLSVAGFVATAQVFLLYKYLEPGLTSFSTAKVEIERTVSGTEDSKSYKNKGAEPAPQM